jgi:signal transduction histidine kinase
MQDGQVKSVMTCVTDVSQLKWAEKFEARKAKDAQEAKRATDEFIDVVSHEMRNPLSAIFQCADSIQRSMKNCAAKGYSRESLFDAVQSNVDSAFTISMCAKHQKTIVDDVLTLSKLEHTLMSISPEPIRPKGLVERVVKMFNSDLTAHGFKVDTGLLPSLKDNGVGWVQCDPSRMNQILVNLITNAIKFTKDEAKREIGIQYGITMSEPRKAFPRDIAWAPNRRAMKDLTVKPEFGTGPHVYLCVQVTDTGVGMTMDEIKRLFARFQQAGSKTMIKYGGSGLGLFISQRLTEMQGGEIGVSSIPNKGSTFAFYVKSRRSEPEAVLMQREQSDLGRRSCSSSNLSPVPLDVFTGVMHVLLVEDNLVNQKVLGKQLAKAGCIVHIANHGVEALDFLSKSDLWHQATKESTHLDIILMDWEMPIMDGLTCSRAIRKLQEEGKVTKHVQIIATTANARSEQIELALGSGIVGSCLTWN